MIDHSELVMSVSQRADVDADTARAAISAVTGTFARHMLNEARERLATALPDTARYAATTLGEIESPDGEQVIEEVAEQLDTTPERARRLSQAVLGALDEAEPGLVDLPTGLRQALEPA
ncbi:hypothetical protein BU204_17950 [Actinophytocola xanthii]|uniref:Uncharacterized protein n=1 Tax=Actinophytocola xanthii TaxID=1912961 RepID=A0A1Q8CPH3_9PSEU|nr:hypothetical protein BU204_17950 [Actinophytocola xanthii]